MRMGRKRVAWEFATGVASDGHDPALELYPVQGVEHSVYKKDGILMFATVWPRLMVTEAEYVLMSSLHSVFSSAGRPCA